jgi:hypothetical protein
LGRGGQHKLGGVYTKLIFYNIVFVQLFIRDFYGIYTFNSLDNFKNGKADQLQLSFAKPGFEKDFAPEFAAMQLGFYAQEVNLALGEEAANTPRTETDKWGIYDRGIVAFLTKAIQELKAEFDEYKSTHP